MIQPQKVGEYVRENSIKLLSKRKINSVRTQHIWNKPIEHDFKRDVEGKEGRKLAVLGRINEDKNQYYSVTRQIKMLEAQGKCV